MELAEVFNSSDVVVSLDSGSSQIAWATQKPYLISIFTSTSAKRTAPFGDNTKVSVTYKNLPKIDTSRNVYNLLYTIAKNLSLNKLKTNKRSVTLEFAENVTEENNETFHKASYDNILNLALSTLKQNEFEVLSLCLIEGYKRKEVAKMLDKSVATVTWQYNNALKKLKSKLEGGGYEKN